MSEYDLAIIGAGPAGMAAACAAAEEGIRVAVIDSSPRIGGQFWRHAHGASEGLSPLHSGRAAYRHLHRRFTAALEGGRLTHLPGTSVWMAEAAASRFTLHLASEGAVAGAAEAPGTVNAPAVVIATGAYDRQLPIPGWELPGVMAAGGIQGFIKQHGFAPGKRYVVAGTGPFLLPVALNIVQAGAQVAAVCESAGLRGWARHLHRAALVPSKMVEGAAYSMRLLAHRVPYRTRTVVTEILGDDRVEAVRVSKVDPRGEVLPGPSRVITGVDGVGLGWGFTPQLELALHLGVDTELGADGSLTVPAGDGGTTNVPGVFVAGEVSGIGGATLAVIKGTAAGTAAAGYVLGNPGAAPGAGWIEGNHRAFAAAMHRVHPVPESWSTWVPDPCTVCRCEEVPAGQIRAARQDLQALDQRTNKGITRAGMGWCQGRTCAYAVSALAEGGAPSADSLRRATNRPVARPVPLRLFSELGREQGGQDPGPQTPR